MLLFIGEEVVVLYMRISLLSLLDTITKQARIVMVNGKLYVEKTYNVEPGVMKWYLIAASNFAFGVYPFKLKPLERLEREVTFLTSKNTCFEKPDIVIVDYMNLKVIREYVRGETYNFSAPPPVHYSIGRELGKCHEAGWALGDTKISNFIYDDGRIYVVDAEQAVNDGKPEYYAWDLLILASTLSIDGYAKTFRIEDRERVFGSILRGYLDGNTKGLEVLSVLRDQMKILVYLLVPFPLSHVFYRKIEELSP